MPGSTNACTCAVWRVPPHILPSLPLPLSLFSPLERQANDVDEAAFTLIKTPLSIRLRLLPISFYCFPISLSWTSHENIVHTLTLTCLSHWHINICTHAVCFLTHALASRPHSLSLSPSLPLRTFLSKNSQLIRADKAAAIADDYQQFLVC